MPEAPLAAIVLTVVPAAIVTLSAEVSMNPPLPLTGAEASSRPATVSSPPSLASTSIVPPPWPLALSTLVGGVATQYGIYRRQGVNTTLVDQVHLVPANVTVTTGGGVADLEFTYVGEALASYTITVQAPDRSWTVTVPQVTGKAFVD